MKKSLIALLIFAMLAISPAILITGCATGPVVQTVEVTQVTAESILKQARIAQNQGKLTDEQFKKVRNTYDKLKMAVDVSIDARIAYLTYQTADTDAQLQAAINGVTGLTVELLSLASQFQLIKTGGGI